MLKDYAVTEFRMVFEPSNNPNQKLAIIVCRLKDSKEKQWSLEIETRTNNKVKELSLYEKAEAIRDIFIQEYHEIKEVMWSFNDKKLLISSKETVDEILAEIAKQI